MATYLCYLQELKACEVGQAIRKGTIEGIVRQIPGGKSEKVGRSANTGYRN